MRALPGRDSRTGLVEPKLDVTRDTVGEAQRSRIRRATGELVAKRGYPGVSVELIVKRARVSFKTFYKHYGNKEEAFIDLFDHTLAATEAQIHEASGDPEVPWSERVALALRAFFLSVLEDPLISRACLVEAPTAGPRILTRYEQLARVFVSLLREGREHNPAAEALPETLEDTLAGSVLWSAYQRLILGDTERIAEFLPEAIELVLRPYVGDRAARRVADGAAPLELKA